MSQSVSRLVSATVTQFNSGPDSADRPVLISGNGLADFFNSALVHVNFGNMAMQLDVVPLADFIWQFSAGVWALFPKLSSSGTVTVDMPSEPVRLDTLFIDKILSGTEVDSDDSVSEFERNLHELMLRLKGSSSSRCLDQPKLSRRSERHKKLSSRFNEDEGFIPKLPRSSKKKQHQEENSEGTSSNPLGISNWSSLQLASYCNACGIVFS